MRRAVCYRDAVIVLGGDPPALAALDRVLAGALSLGTGGISDVVLSMSDAQPRIIALGRDLLGRLRDRLHGASRADRTQRLAAAHAVLVITAYFEALGEAGLPAGLRDLRLSRGQEIELAGGPADRDGAAGSFLDALLSAAPPQPTPDVPAERFGEILAGWYTQLSGRLAALLRGLPAWDRLDDAGRAAAARTLSQAIPDDAVRRYADGYARLAIEMPEFRFWAGQAEFRATRAEVRRALAGVERLLADLAVRQDRPGDAAAAALAAGYRAVLERPILMEGDAPSGARLPSLAEGYLDPDFRVRAVTGGELPSDESWWAGVPVRGDLTEYLAGTLTSPQATVAPLVVLGQPGAGKSLLTMVLAARLPAAGFLPVRVVLREVAAQDEITDQVEQAIRAVTGRRAQWPDIAAAVPGATPVVLLDGFDELLQATGVSQSDYLLKVARFQQREADQGRPAVVLVTTRTAVADRARYPDGTVALRLEPFRGDQVRRWLDMWNEFNEPRLRGRGLEPLTGDVLGRYAALACEPLLLLMLALYDADANALRRAHAAGGLPLDETRLYEDLLTSFASREVARWGDLPEAELAARVEQEMQRLSLIAFSMVNRRRQWVTEAELDADLAALLGSEGGAAASFRAPLSPAGIAVGRFFFVQRSQAMSADTRLQTFEFLHATFGEYLAARLTVQLAAGLLAQRPALAVGSARLDDDLLYVLLSFGPLSARQMLRFVAGACQRDVPQAARARLADTLIAAASDARHRTTHRHADYRPLPLPTSARHAVYGANLVLLILSLVPSVTASRLFGGAADPPARWHRTALLWRSALTEPDWTDLALALTLRHTWSGPARDLEISLSADPRTPPEPVDPYWLYGYPPDSPERGDGVWFRHYADEVLHKLDISGGTNDSAIRHALEPLARWLSPAILTFHGFGDGPARSVAHDLLSLLMARVSPCPDDELAAIYRRLDTVLNSPPPWGREHGRVTARLMIHCLRDDAGRLPAADVATYLDTALMRDVDRDMRTMRAIPVIAEAALARLAEADDARDGLRRRLVVYAVAAVRALHPAAFAGLTYAQQSEEVAALAGPRVAAMLAADPDYFARESAIFSRHADVAAKTRAITRARRG